MSIKRVASPKPLSSLDVDWTEWSEVPRFGVRYRHLSRAAVGEDYRVGVAIEELPSGKQSSPAHYHFVEEEHVCILEGALTVRIGAGTYEMTAGDYVCFPAGQRAGHCLINNSGGPCRYVIVGKRNPNDVVVYTDSDKVLVRALGRRALFNLVDKRRYWDGEDTGLPEDEMPPSDHIDTESETSVKAVPPISSREVAWNEEGPREGTRFGGCSKHLTYAAVGPGYRVGVLIESPARGRRLAPRVHGTSPQNPKGAETPLSGSQANRHALSRTISSSRDRRRLPSSELLTNSPAQFSAWAA